MASKYETRQAAMLVDAQQPEITEASASHIAQVDRGRILEALTREGLFSKEGVPQPRRTSNAKTVLQRRYLAKDRKGEPIENVGQMFRRVARNLAGADRGYGVGDDEVAATEEKFYRAMEGLEFLPNSPTLMNAGRELQQLSACFVLPVKDSLDSIFEMVKATALIHKSGGGTGFAFSQLRPSGDVVGSTGGIASGPVSFIRAFDTATDVVKQGGTRRGANMGILHVTHPDILKFIRSKEDGQNLSNFNISVAVTEEFMEKAERGEDYDLVNPRTGVVTQQLNAREVFSELVEMAWTTGDPGIIFLDRINRDNPNPQLGAIESTNPCGEQPLLPFESCNLGSLNLALMLKAGAEGAVIDWERLERTVGTAVHLLDNVVDMNNYPLPEIDEMSRKTRRIGLGVMGFADMLLQMGIPYASEEALETAEQVMEFIDRKTKEASAALAVQRGCFPAWEGSVYNRGGESQRMRNSAPTTIAPTGTISIIAGCSSGIEPLFALSYVRNVMDNDRLVEGNPFFEAVAKHEGFHSNVLMEELAQRGSLHHMGGDVPEWAQELFITSHDVTPEWHVRMQAAFQRHTDNAVSKTINFPGEATREDVEDSYMLAFREGCKGITIYRDGSKDNQVLSPGQGQQTAIEAVSAGQQALTPRPRPQEMVGVTERVRTGHGNMYVTINFDAEGSPFEVFSALGKAGGCDSAQLEAISRLVSLSLRSGIDPEAVMEQLRGITCCPAWDRGVLVRSAPDAVALSLEHALHNGPPRDAVQLKLSGSREVETAWSGMLEGRTNGNGAVSQGLSGHGNSPNERNRCPDCNGTLAFQEGCLLCSSCGWNRCGS